MSSVLEQSRSDYFARFFRSWVRDPFTIGAVAPSGRLLARLMAQNVTAGARVIELGAGTGTVTRAILERGVRPENLVVVEQNADFARILTQRFPHCRVLQADALSLASYRDELAGGGFDFVISGLPLLLFSRREKLRVLSQAFEMLGPDGCFHQFTYGGRCPVGRELRARLRLRSSLIGFTPLNLPPAFVYRFARVF
ncbi:MAG TPA: methyltransferase domain-containing protein [Gammaproteobacteria bacterium]